METTDRLGLKITTTETFEDDDVKDTITEYGSNFEKVEQAVQNITTETDELTIGSEYAAKQRIWNSDPSVGNYIGWVVLRSGIYAPNWEPLKRYDVGDLIFARSDNGNVYECVVSGRSMAKTPVFLTSPNSEFFDARGNNWMSQYVYEVDDVVFSTDGSKIFYYICETAGLSSLEEPDWDNVGEGITTIDGSVVWRKEKLITWKQVGVSCNLRPFGLID